MGTVRLAGSAALLAAACGWAVAPGSVALCEIGSDTGGQLSENATPQSQAADRPPAISQPDFSKLPTGRVLRIVDAATVVVSVGRQGQALRLVGVEPPSATEQARVAKDFLENLLRGERVYVQYAANPPEQDEFGRLLALLYRVPDGLFVNLELVRQGYAKVGADLSAEQQQVFDYYAYYARQARQAGRGQWGQRSGGASPEKREAKATQAATSAEDEGEDPIVYITRTGKKYHRADCPHLRKEGTPIKRSEAKARGLEPCSRCKPP